MTPHPDQGVVVGTHVFLEGRSNCGTVRFTINGQPRAETGGGNQTESMKTDEFGTGTFEICFMGRGDGGWDNAARNCKTLYVFRVQEAPDDTAVGVCRITQFNLSSSVIQAGGSVTVSAAAECGGGVRAIRVLVGGHEKNQFGGSSITFVWQTESNSRLEGYEICVTATHGEWRDEVRSCAIVTLTAYEQPPAPPIQGPPAENTDNGTGRCTLDQLTVSSSRVQVGVPIQISASGHCDGNVSPTIRYLVGGHEVQQYPRTSFTASWVGYVAEGYEICATITGTDWYQENRRCTQVTLTNEEQPPGPPAQGEPSSPPSAPPSDGGGGSSNGGNESSNTCPNLPARLVVGQRGRNIADGRGNTNVRVNPGDSVSFSISEGMEFDVIGGPTCLTADSGNLIRWFQISVAGRGSGWAAEVINTGYILEPISGNSSSDGGSSNPGNPPQVCSGNLSRLGEGMTAVVNDATSDPANVRSGAGINFARIDQLAAGSQVAIVAGPECADGWIWWFVQYSNKSGWIAEVDSRVLYNLVPVGNGESNGNNQRNIQSFQVQLDDGSFFTFRFDMDRKWILNGSEYVVSELAKVDRNVHLANDVYAKTREVFLYAVPVVGSSDRNVKIIRDSLCNNDTSCESRIFYQVGDRLMDVSGVGNIVYGYYVDYLNLPRKLSDTVANWDQLLSSVKALEYITTRDNPDDIMQREVGVELRKRGLSESNLNNVANDLGLY